MRPLTSAIRFSFCTLLLSIVIAQYSVCAALTQSVQFTPVEDVYIENAIVNDGNQLRCQSSVRTVYMKFTVTGIPAGSVITDVNLSLQENGDTGNGTLRFFRGSDTSWTESSITDLNAPTTLDEVGIRSGSVSSAEVIDVDVDSLVTGNDDYTVIVEMDSGGNDVAFGSSESVRIPLLTVTYELVLPDVSFGFEETFNDLLLGSQPTSIWSSKWDGNNPSQRLLWTVGASNGVGSSQGYALDVTTASRNYHTIYQTAVAGAVGHTLNLRADFRFSTTGAPLDETPAPGISGVNDGFIGLVITTEPEWWKVGGTNGNFTFQIARREDNNWGVLVDGINAWLSNADIGLDPGLTASESDWFTLSAQIAPNAGGTAYEIVCTVYYQGTALYTHPAIELDNTVYPIGGDMYGGLTTGYNSDPSNTGDATGEDATLQMPVGSIAKIASVDVDNFSFLVYPDALEPHGLTMDPTAQDLDANGLPDIWEAIYQAWGLDPAADSDGDGVNNGTEAGFGTDPFDPFVSPSVSIRKGEGNNIILSWAQLEGRPGSALCFTEFGTLPLPVATGTPVLNGDRWELTIPISQDAEFFQIASSESDLDGDGVPDWIEPWLGFSSDPGDSESVALDKSYDTDGDEVLDTNLSGDLSAFNEIYRRSSPGERLTQAQAARLLLQGTFGPASVNEVDYVARIGAEAWLDEQLLLPVSFTRPYIDAIKADFENGQTDPDLAGYQINGGGGTPFVGGGNYMTAWMRVALQSEDQLRQRVAFALSQILVGSRSAAGLANQPRATAAYYDLMIEHAFGNFEDLLLQVSISPYMGNYLSHLGNRKADVSIERYPDENYAREIMQLFSIGLWELNLDGTQKLDAQGEPIPTYGNYEITELARVFTGTHYASLTNSGTSFGSGWRDDGDSVNEWMITPMKVYAVQHDFDSKQVVAGNGTYHTIPARGTTDENAMQDVEDVVYHLVRHPNTAPFICRQLIQFLITSNPSPEYVARVASVFVDNGSSVTGDMNAVVRAIYLDEEARDPLEHLATPYFGQLREPLLRYMHLARMLKLDRHEDLLTWDWGNHQAETLQEPMKAPSVFNYYRPDFRLFGTLADNGLDSPAFGIVNSYSSISFPNWMWRLCYHGFKYIDYDYPEDLSELVALAGDIPVLLDHLSLLYTAGTLSAESRQIITTALTSESNLTERARLAAYLVLVSPEGSCLK
ncbi:MAG: DUF1800 family protein [Opitutales bacterium]|nr:DUF1800 family protein [Opitutales bacterium]MDP5079673.1 DUF1800 family protein [Opitutales bacterium]